jgi:glycosyltransferase involved in cell wall biosynthesis
MATELETPCRSSKRILIVGNPYSPLIGERAQVGRKAGYEIYWYSVPKVESNGLVGTFSPPLGRFKRLSMLWSPFFLRQTIHHLRPDLIHAHFAYQHVHTFILSHFKPLILTVMGGDILPDQLFNGPRKRFIKKMLDAADIITSKSSFLDKALNRIGDYAHKIRRVIWGIDTQTFRPDIDVSFLRKRWNIDRDDLVFFCPRICKPFYNKHVTLQAFGKYLRQATGKAKLMVAELFPDVAYQRLLRRLVTELDLTEHVRFVGTIPHPEMPAYFNLSDIMIAIPLSDGMPQSLYEAMACGTFPILGKLPQYQELIQDGMNGRLVSIGDVNALAEAMGWAASHPLERKAMALINRQCILEIADKEAQDQLVNSIYEELCQKYAE